MCRTHSWTMTGTLTRECSGAGCSNKDADLEVGALSQVVRERQKARDIIGKAGISGLHSRLPRGVRPRPTERLNNKRVKGGSREGHRPWADISVSSLVALEFLSFSERAGLIVPPRIGLHPVSATLKQCDLGQVTYTSCASAFPSQSSTRVNFQRRRGPSLLPLPFFMEY